MYGWKIILAGNVLIFLIHAVLISHIGVGKYALAPLITIALFGGIWSGLMRHQNKLKNKAAAYLMGLCNVVGVHIVFWIVYPRLWAAVVASIPDAMDEGTQIFGMFLGPLAVIAVVTITMATSGIVDVMKNNE